MKVCDFLQSRTFVTHITGLLGILTTSLAVPNSTLVTLAVALLTGITQASHAYQATRAKPTVTTNDILSAISNSSAIAPAPSIESLGSASSSSLEIRPASGQ